MRSRSAIKGMACPDSGLMTFFSVLDGISGTSNSGRTYGEDGSGTYAGEGGQVATVSTSYSYGAGGGAPLSGVFAHVRGPNEVLPRSPVVENADMPS